METDFPRGGVKHGGRKRMTPKPVKDLFKTEEGTTKRKSKGDLVDKSTPTGKADKQKKKKLTPAVPQGVSENAESLKFKDVEQGMHILGCVRKVEQFTLTLDLPGGLQGEVSITGVSDKYTEQLNKLISSDDDEDDEDDEQEVAHLSDMFHPGMILPCKVMAIKIRAGSKKKIFLSVNPKIVNKDLSLSHISEGLKMSATVTACEDHGYVMDVGVDGVSAFLSQKHAEKYVKYINNSNPLYIGQVVRCCVLSVSSRVVKLGLNPHQVDKAQLGTDVTIEKAAILSGMKVTGTVKKVLKNGLRVDFSGNTGYIHQTHTTEYSHRNHFSRGQEVSATVLYTLSNNKTVYLSLLPHLSCSTCSSACEKYTTLADKKTLHDVSVLDALKKAVYFQMEDGLRALATRVNLTAVTDFQLPLHKTFHIGDKQRCTVFGFNLIENVLLIRIQKSLPEQTSPETQTSPSLKRKSKDTPESKSLKSKSEIDSDTEPVSKKKKTVASELLPKSEKKKLKSLKEVSKNIVKEKSEDTDSIEIESDTVKSAKKKKMKKQKETVITGEKESCEDEHSAVGVAKECKKRSKVKLEYSESSKSELETPSKKKKLKDSTIKKKTAKETPGQKNVLRPTEETDSGVEMNKMSDSDDDKDMKVPRVGNNPPRLSIPAGFSWSEDFSMAPPASYNDSSDEDKEDKKQVTKTSQERRKERIEEEKKIFAYERQQLEGEQVPVTSEDFDRLTLQSPDSSLVWTRYMALHLETVEIDKARTVAERALKTISFREEQEKLNIWVAYLNLENMYGGEEQLRAVFERAVQQNEPIKIYKQMVQIYVNSGKMEEAEKMYNTMCKKFSQDKSVWTGFGLFFFKNSRFEPARKVLQRCLKCLEKREHVEMISKFAQLEYKYGESQRGCTMFENILTNYPKRTDLWSVYLDMVIKAGNMDDARSLFERVIHMKMSTKKMQFFFKKYMDFEKKHGDAKSVEKVKQKAVEYVESQGFTGVS